MIIVGKPSATDRGVWDVFRAVATLHMHIEARMVGDHVRLTNLLAPVGGDPFTWCPIGVRFTEENRT